MNVCKLLCDWVAADDKMAKDENGDGATDDENFVKVYDDGDDKEAVLTPNGIIFVAG